MKDLSKRILELEKGLKNFISRANIEFVLKELDRLEKEKANLNDINLIISQLGIFYFIKKLK
jgi:hypothetical protein